MYWSPVSFGVHRGKSLPQIILSDPDWFFWALEQNAFKGKGALEGEAESLANKARNVRVPPKGPYTLSVEYVFYRDGGFSEMRLVPSDLPLHDGASPTQRKDVIDLSVVWQHKQYEKLGNKNLLSAAKKILFGSKRVTKKDGRAVLRE